MAAVHGLAGAGGREVEGASEGEMGCGLGVECVLHACECICLSNTFYLAKLEFALLYPVGRGPACATVKTGDIALAVCALLF